MTTLTTGTELMPAATRDGDVVSATVQGEIDLHNSPELRYAMLNVLLASEPRSVVLDMGQVPYMDSSGLAVLVESLKRLQRRGGKITLCRLQPRVKGLLEIARLDTLFTIVP